MKTRLVLASLVVLMFAGTLEVAFPPRIDQPPPADDNSASVELRRSGIRKQTKFHEDIESVRRRLGITAASSSSR